MSQRSGHQRTGTVVVSSVLCLVTVGCDHRGVDYWPQTFQHVAWVHFPRSCALLPESSSQAHWLPRKLHSVCFRGAIFTLITVCVRDAVHASSGTTKTVLIRLHGMILTLHVLVIACGHSIQAFFSGSQRFALVTLDVTHRRLHLIFSPVDTVQEVRLLVVVIHFAPVPAT